VRELSRTLGALHKLNQLERCKAPVIGKLQATKEHRYGKTDWVVNPITVVKIPQAILKFKALADGDRLKLLEASEDRIMSPHDLCTKQLEVAEKGVENFILNPDVKTRGRVIILAVGDKNFIWNGNHRCVAALLRGKKIKTQFLRLR
jgi:hypothetical protein